jgi:hypothetical protein
LVSWDSVALRAPATAYAIKSEAKPVQGFAGYHVNKKMTNSLVLGVESKGQGNVVYLVDNPLFRCFWESGKFLFANAVFMVGVN